MFGAFRSPLQLEHSGEFGGGTRRVMREQQEWHMPNWVKGMGGETYEHRKRLRMERINEHRDVIHRALNQRSEARRK